jgi:hypothetical protein
MRPAVPEYWRATPQDLVPFLLGEPGLVHDQHAIGVAEVFSHVAEQVIADGIGVPAGAGQ